MVYKQIRRAFSAGLSAYVYVYVCVERMCVGEAEPVIYPDPRVFSDHIRTNLQVTTAGITRSFGEWSAAKTCVIGCAGRIAKSSRPLASGAAAALCP